jgi:outer membrane receptor protein involved in Fe transport
LFAPRLQSKGRPIIARGSFRLEITMAIRIKYILALLVALASLCSVAHAEEMGTINGRITDANTGDALVEAKIFLQGTKLSAMTDEEGKYSIPDVPTGQYKVIASCKEYKRVVKDIEVLASETIVVDFELEAESLELGKVKVKGKKMSQVDIIRQSPMAVTVIDASAFRGREVTLNELISKAAGVRVRQAGGLGSEDRINIHGMEGKRVKIFIDGTPINVPGDSFGINDIPIQLIERIEIYKGVVPAHLGGDTLGGAINVVTREYKTDYIDTTYSAGSYNTHRASCVFKKVFDDAGFEIGTGGFFNYSDNDYEMESPYQPGLVVTRDHDKYLAYIGAVGMTFTKAWFDAIELELIHYGNAKEIQGVRQNIQHAETNGGAFVVASTFEKEGFLHENLDFEYHLVPVYFIGQFEDKSYYRYDWFGNEYPSPNGQGEVDYDPHDSDDRRFDVLQRLNLNYDINDIHNLNLNTVATYAANRPDDPLASEHAGYNVSDYPSNLLSVVNGLTHEALLFGDKMANSIGIKLYHINSEIPGLGLMDRHLQGKPKVVKNTMTKFGISEAFRCWVLPSLNLKASGEHAVRLPDTTELFGDGVGVTTSPDLKPESSENANIGALFQKQDVLGMPKLEAEVNGFFRYTKDMIKLSGNNLFTGYVNLGEIRTLGADGEVRADISKYLYVYANATYQDLRDVREYVAGTKTPNPTKGLRVPNIPWFHSNFGLELYKDNLFRKGIFTKLFWESSYVAEFFYDWEVSKFQKHRIPSTFQHIVGIEFTMENGMILSAEVHNLTDAKVLDIYNQPRAGRTFRVSMRYSWFRDKVGR